MKKLLSILMCFVLIISTLTFVSIPASAEAYSGECGNNVRWSLDSSTGVLRITGSGDMYNYYGNFDSWYVKTVIINNGVTSIGDYAFEYCDSLKSITIPNSVTSIGDYAFEYCDSLTSITIPNSVTSIGDYAFEDCSSLTNITIGNSVTSIGDYAFSGCSKLTSITIPNSVTSIGDYAFEDCSSLTNITIPDSVTSIGEYAFEDCSSLTSITIGNGLTRIDDYQFSELSSLEKVIIGNSVETIGDDAFYGCSKLKSITIPNSVTSIGEYAFEYCSSLTNITLPNSVKYIQESAFARCKSLKKIIIPNSVKSIGDYAFEHCTSLTSVVIPKSVFDFGEEVFYNCGGLAIYGYAGSAAKSYAKEYGIKFYALINAPQDTTTDESGCAHQTYYESFKKATYFEYGYAGDINCCLCEKTIKPGHIVPRLILKIPKFKLISGKKQFKIKYTKVADATGFQVSYKLKGKIMARTFETKKSATRVIKNLKKGTYQVQIRAVVKQGKKSVCSAWSKTQKVKVK